MKVLRKAIPYFKKYLPAYVFAIFCGLINTIVWMLIPQVLSLIVDRVLNPLLGAAPESNSSILSFLIDGFAADDYYKIFGALGGVFLALMAVGFASFYLKWVLIHKVSLPGDFKLRRAALDKIHESGSRLLGEYSSGELITIANSDPVEVREIFSYIIPFILEAATSIAVAIVFIVRMNWVSLFVPLGIGAVFSVMTVFYMRRSEKVYDAMWEKRSTLNTAVQESIYGIRTIKSYAREKLRRSYFDKKHDELDGAYRDATKMESKYEFLYQGVISALFLLTAAVTIYLGVTFSLTTGECVSYVSYAQSMSFRFMNISFLLADLQRCNVSGKRLFGFLDKHDTTLDGYGKDKVSARPDIELKGVCVKSGDNKLLYGVSLSLPYGKKVGIMGRTGSGKSVLLKAMQSFMPIDGGEILIDGKPHKQYEKSEIVRAFSFGMQDVFLFSNTIASNIAFYEPSGEEERIQRCAEIAQVDEFALKMPDGYDTVVGEKGFGLSGGQKQRVSVARALYKDAPVIVLDDCTSSLDMATERKIFENIKRFCGEKTLVIATHRASAIADCDEILFLENGSVVERGTFDELMALGGRYAEIYKLQEGEVAA